MIIEDEDLETLRSLLLRVKAEAVSERNAVQRLQTAYGDRRDATNTRLAFANETIRQANYFLAKMKD